MIYQLIWVSIQDPIIEYICIYTILTGMWNRVDTVWRYKLSCCAVLHACMGPFVWGNG